MVTSWYQVMSKVINRNPKEWQLVVAEMEIGLRRCNEPYYNLLFANHDSTLWVGIYNAENLE